ELMILARKAAFAQERCGKLTATLPKRSAAGTSRYLPRSVATGRSDDARGFEQTGDRPRLVAGDRTPFGDFDQITFVVLVVFVMRLVAIRTLDDLAKQPMLRAALNQHADGLVQLVAHHAAGQRTLALGRGLDLCCGAHCCSPAV